MDVDKINEQSGLYSRVIERPIAEVDGAFIEFILNQPERYDREEVNSSMVAFHLSDYTYGDLGTLLLRGISTNTKITNTRPLFPHYEEPAILYQMEAEGHLTITEDMKKSMEMYCKEENFDYQSLYVTNLRRRWKEVRITLHKALIEGFLAFLKSDGLISDSQRGNVEKVNSPTLKTQMRFDVFKRLKDENPTWTLEKVALEARAELEEDVTAETVRNAYREMNETWVRGDRIR